MITRPATPTPAQALEARVQEALAQVSAYELVLLRELDDRLKCGERLRFLSTMFPNTEYEALYIRGLVERYCAIDAIDERSGVYTLEYWLSELGKHVARHLSKAERQVLERLDSGDLVIFDARFDTYSWASNGKVLDTELFEGLERRKLVQHLSAYGGRYTYRHDIAAAGQEAISAGK